MEYEATEISIPKPEEVAQIPDIKYEFLDHPADIQIHAWGDNLREAYEQAAMGMFAYMTEIETVEMKGVQEVEAEGDDLQSLLFHFLDECLFVFSCDPYFIVRKVVITEWNVGGAGAEAPGEQEGEKEQGQNGGEEETEEKGGQQQQHQRKTEQEQQEDAKESETSGEGEAAAAPSGEGEEVYKIRARLYGEEFQLDKHPQGTEVKAITYASMQVYNNPDQHEVYVIVDI